ncbi:MAG: ABC transporter ATP-binding protein, partial [Spirochaetota bacterium]
ILMRRIFSYLKPYRLYFLLALLALLLGTVGEMLSPVLLRQAVDRDILPYYRKIDGARADKEAVKKLSAGGKEIHVGRWIFVPASLFSALARPEKKRLTESGVLSEENYLLFTRQAGIETIAENHPEFFISSRSSAAIAISEHNLKKLAAAETKVLRQENYSRLFTTVLQFLAVLAGIFIFTFIQIFLMTVIGQKVMKDLRLQLYDHTIRLSLRFIDSNPVGRLVTRITNDVETINELFTTVITSFLKDVSLMLGVFVTLFLLDFRLAGISLLCLPPLAIASFLYRTKARDAFRRVRAAVSRFNSFLSEHISGINVVQLFDRESLSLKDFNKRNSELLKANLREMYVFATFRPLVDILATAAIGVILYFGAASFLKGLISLGVLIAFINLIGKFFDPVRDLSEKYSLLQSAMAGSERVFALLDENSFIPQPAEVSIPAGNRPGSRVKENSRGGNVAFENVSFHYKPGEPVIRNLSFRVDEGENVAIVGFTGAGKTTIISLLTRLWDVEGGRILFDGLDIRDFTTDHLRTRVQSVLQEVFLFSGTIEENIRLGSDIPFEAVQKAAEMVKADSFINRLPQGYKTILNERGSNLSTGQRQLLSFARVIAHNPDVLILDEATASIDTETEALIQEALKVLLKGRTSLVIAHRLSTIKNADRILVLHHGRLVEEGRHDELIQKRSIYYNLYKLQYKEN